MRLVCGLAGYVCSSLCVAAMLAFHTVVAFFHSLIAFCVAEINNAATRLILIHWLLGEVFDIILGKLILCNLLFCIV